LGLTVLAITLPIPYGIYIPLFAIGASFGRGFGEGISLLAQWTHSNLTIIPRGYAAVGAAALCGGATRTVSSAVIILELTNDLNYFIPVLLCVAIACGIGNMLNPSIYDVFVKLKGLPYLPFMRVKGDSTVAHDIMDRSLYYITKKTSVTKLQELLDKRTEFVFPVVEADDNLLLVGSILRHTVEHVVEFCKSIELQSEGEGAQESLLYEDEGSIALRPRASRRPIPAPSPEPTGESSSDNSVEIAESEERQTNRDGGAILLTNVAREADDTAVDLNLLALTQPWVEIDPAPFSVTESTPVRKILYMFTMLGGSVLWVTYKGKLVGSITKQSLAKSLTPKIDH